jgi:hypothetical protein
MPTRFDLEPDRSVARLDLSPAHSGIFTPGIEAIDITEHGVRRFNAVAHSVNELMPALSADQLAGVARRVLRTATAGGESPFVRSRLRRAVELRTMALDAAWPLSETTARRVGDLLAYIDDPQGLIRDDVPFIGRLDDALLVDIAMDTLRPELDDYAEFRRYRDAEAMRLGESDASQTIDRAHWQRARDDELRLEQQLRRVRGTSYATGAAARVFRVC